MEGQDMRITGNLIEALVRLRTKTDGIIDETVKLAILTAELADKVDYLEERLAKLEARFGE